MGVELDGHGCSFGRKPTWEVRDEVSRVLCAAGKALTPALQTGASFALRKRGAKGIASVQAPPAWVVSADDGDGELVDEEALLTEEDRQRPSRPVGPDDCEARLRFRLFVCSGSAPPPSPSIRRFSNPTGWRRRAKGVRELHLRPG